MKKVILKLDQVVKLLSYADFSNRKELLNGFETLKKLFNASLSQEFLLENITKLKTNPFYRQFKLDGDPCYMKELVRKVNDIEIIERLLKSIEIKYSQQEEWVIKQHLNNLISLSILKQDLNRGRKDEFFEVYLEDFEKLKKIISSELISFNDIQWFFDSDLFEFISSTSDCCDKELIDLYKTFLENTEIKTRKDFTKHDQLLKTTQNEKHINYKEYYDILSATKKQLSEKIRNSPIISKPTPLPITNQHCIFKKFSTLKKLSPTAKKALYNNLKNYEDPSSIASLKR
ncbi:MAG: hypothetical protein E6K54_05050 [Gammaproteobacteria bacterium]|nr:MAG: hypothetical protein E6K54_05050 [Gammaproteobacteria bacterium]